MSLSFHWFSLLFFLIGLLLCIFYLLHWFILFFLIGLLFCRCFFFHWFILFFLINLLLDWCCFFHWFGLLSYSYFLVYWLYILFLFYFSFSRFSLFSNWFSRLRFRSFLVEYWVILHSNFIRKIINIFCSLLTCHCLFSSNWWNLLSQFLNLWFIIFLLTYYFMNRRSCRDFSIIILFNSLFYLNRFSLRYLFIQFLCNTSCLFCYFLCISNLNLQIT